MEMRLFGWLEERWNGLRGQTFSQRTMGACKRGMKLGIRTPKRQVRRMEGCSTTSNDSTGSGVDRHFLGGNAPFSAGSVGGRICAECLHHGRVFPSSDVGAPTGNRTPL